VNPSFRIRRGTAADIPAILRHRLGMLAEMWLAETESGEVVGGGAVYIVPWPGNPEERKRQRAFLLNVFTEPPFRRQGIARSVVQAMVDWCRREGYRSVRLMASETGRPLYQSMGFLPTAEMRLIL
jgi:GNAT superfamily N-acetyltransferase